MNVDREWLTFRQRLKLAVLAGLVLGIALGAIGVGFWDVLLGLAGVGVAAAAAELLTWHGKRKR